MIDQCFSYFAHKMLHKHPPRKYKNGLKISYVISNTIMKLCQVGISFKNANKKSMVSLEFFCHLLILFYGV